MGRERTNNRFCGFSVSASNSDSVFSQSFVFLFFVFPFFSKPDCRSAHIERFRDYIKKRVEISSPLPLTLNNALQIKLFIHSIINISIYILSFYASNSTFIFICLYLFIKLHIYVYTYLSISIYVFSPRVRRK